MGDAGNLQPDRVAVLELGDRFFGRVHRDDARGGHTVGERPIRFGEEVVPTATETDAEVVVGRGGSGESEGRVEDRVVDADLGQALGQQSRSDRCREITRVVQGRAPPTTLRSARCPTIVASRSQAVTQW